MSLSACSTDTIYEGYSVHSQHEKFSMKFNYAELLVILALSSMYPSILDAKQFNRDKYWNKSVPPRFNHLLVYVTKREK